MDMKYMDKLQFKMFNAKTCTGDVFRIIEITKERGFYYVKILS